MSAMESTGTSGNCGIDGGCINFEASTRVADAIGTMFVDAAGKDAFTWLAAPGTFCGTGTIGGGGKTGVTMRGAMFFQGCGMGIGV